MSLLLGLIVIFAIFTYPKWSYKVWAKECEETVTPWTGKKRNDRES